ncbi:hypothetical protein GCM10028857_17530 [Salinarchaeum chitinilyticum]
MDLNRRSVLRKASALSALAVGASTTASAADCSGVPQWDETTLYAGSDRVQHPDADGVNALWEVAVNSRNAEPSRSSAYWNYVGDCGSGGGGNTAPTASFTTSISTPSPGESVDFDASGSSDADGSIASYSWAFGDGASASGQSVTHSFGSAGDYTVTLTVTDDDGATATASQTVSVSSGTSNQAPSASFTVAPSSPEPGQSTTFDAADSSDADGSIASYSWALGDGASASGQSVTHSFGSAGDHTVTLTVTDDDGATDTNSTTVSVESSTGGGGSGDTTFAPYCHMTTQPGTSLVDHYNQADNDAFTLAFVLSDGNGNAAWDGAPDQLVGDFGLAPEIQAYQDAGGEVIVSFGGAVGTMIAQDATDVAKIKSEYETVMDTYGVTHLDFDIESVDQDAVDRRNQALAELQSERPELKVSYTLRCRTTGLTSHGTYVVESARDAGVDLQYVNVMTMNYGWVEPTAATVKDSANGTHSDLMSILGISSEEAWGMVGITPMIGTNNVGGEHSLAAAEAVSTFVEDKGVGLVSFWSIDRDNGGCPGGTVSATCSGISQAPYEFSEIYNDVQ